MTSDSLKFIQVIGLLAILFLASKVSLTQTYDQTEYEMPPVGSPLEFEIKGGELHLFSLKLKANQTARVEIVQNGVDVALGGMNPQGKYFMLSQSPSGFFGDDLILLTTKEAGKYKVSVEPLEMGARKGKYTILLKEIRNTTPEDERINAAFRNIAKLSREAYILKYKGTIEGRRAALAKFDEVIVNAKVKKDRVWEAMTLLDKGLIYETLGEFQNALGSYLKSLEVWREIENRQFEGSAVNNIGSVYRDLGEYEKAISQFEQAIKIQRRIGNRKSEGIYLNNLANAYLELKNYSKAEEFLNQSLVIKKEDESKRGKRSVANTLHNLGVLSVSKGDVQKGLVLHQQALDIRRGIEHYAGIAISLLSIGTAEWDSGLKEKGFQNIKEANTRAERLGDRRMLAESFYRLAISERDRGNREKAIESIEKGLEIVERIRSEIAGSEMRYSYFSTVQNFYDLYTDLVVSRFEETKKQDDVALALEISEKARSRSLIELLREARVDFRRSVGAESIEMMNDLQSKLDGKYSSRVNLLGNKAKPTRIAKINTEINDLNAKIQTLNTKIRRDNPGYADLTDGKTISGEEIQSLLDDETVLLEYKLGDKRSFAWLVTKDTVQISILPPRKEVEEKAKLFYRLVAENNRSDENKTLAAARELSKMLLAPFASQLSGKRLAIVSDGALQYTPFSALKTPGSAKVLADEHEIVVLPSATVLSQLRKNSDKRKVSQKAIAIFADPVFDSNDSRISKNSLQKVSSQNASLRNVYSDFRFSGELPRLLFSRQEAKNIMAFTGNGDSVVKTDFEANRENVAAEDLRQYRIVHFATHGLLNTARPELSGLVFSLVDENGRRKQGFLGLNDVFNLKLSSDLVVLSACQTALGKDVRGEGLIGLSRGFLYAGSKRIIASLWKVDDAATAQFMKLFYRNHLQKNMSASAALRQAKIDMKKIPRFRSSYYWSAFTLLGEWQ